MFDMHKKNFPEKVGELFPFSHERTKRENRLVGTFALTMTLIVGVPSIGDFKRDVTKAETVCVTTDGDNTRWGNAAQAQDMLGDLGVHVPDTREVLDAVPTTGPVEVCGEKRIGFLSKLFGRLTLQNAEIEVHDIHPSATIAQQSIEG